MRTCGRCGKTRPDLDMGSFADVPYCHGSWDPSPTCYETATLDAFDDADEQRFRETPPR